MKVGIVAAVVALAVSASPAAAADPEDFPDLSGYTAADAQQYHNYGSYPTTGGVQFSTPDGYRCRIANNGRGATTWEVCWGSLPGTPDNSVRVSSGSSFAAGAFENVDPAGMDGYQQMGADGHVVDSTYSAADYKALPAGSKVVMSYSPGVSATCGVSVGMTACVIETSSDKHGFVLSPQGSWTF